MSKFRPVRAVLLSCAVASVWPALAAEEPTLVPNMRVFCQYRVAAIFPEEPKIRDIMYSNSGRTVPARQFYVERGMDKYTITIADYTNGPAIDDTIVENAVAPYRQRGEIRDQFPEDYTPGIPGRQMNILDPGGRQYRVSVYMNDHRLYINETYAPPNDFTALQFEQSMLVINAEGFDRNAVANPTRYPCMR